MEKAKQRAELSLKREDEGMLGLNSQTLMPRFSRVLTEANMRLAEAADDHDTALMLLQESCRTARKSRWSKTKKQQPCLVSGSAFVSWLLIG